MTFPPRLLLAIGRDAGLELDLHAGITAARSACRPMTARSELLERIARQEIDLRYELRGRHLRVRPDPGSIRSYAVDYVNLSRDMRGTVATSTQIATTGSGGPGQSHVVGRQRQQRLDHPDRDARTNDFWNTLEHNLLHPRRARACARLRRRACERAAPGLPVTPT